MASFQIDPEKVYNACQKQLKEIQNERDKEFEKEVQNLIGKKKSIFSKKRYNREDAINYLKEKPYDRYTEIKIRYGAQEIRVKEILKSAQMAIDVKALTMRLTSADIRYIGDYNF